MDLMLILALIIFPILLSISEWTDTLEIETHTVRPIFPWKWPRSEEGTSYPIPYAFKGQIKDDNDMKAQIHEAMQQIQQQTCIRFVEMAKNEGNDDDDDNEENDNIDAVKFFMGKKCRTLIGHFTGENPVELAENCANASEILTLLCYKIGLHQAIKELSPRVVEEINDIYPCEIKENTKQMGDIGDAGVKAKMDGDGNLIDHLKSQENERIMENKVDEAFEEMDDVFNRMNDQFDHVFGPSPIFGPQNELFGGQRELENEKERMMPMGSGEGNKNGEVPMPIKFEKEYGDDNDEYGEEEMKEEGESPPANIDVLINEINDGVDNNGEELHHSRWANAQVGNGNSRQEKWNALREPLILICFILYIALASVFIGRILMKCCGPNDSDERNNIQIGSRRKSSLGRRLRHFSWDASAFGGVLNNKPRDHLQQERECHSRPESPIQTISNGDLRRISVVNFQLPPSNGREYLTVPIYDGLS